MRTVERDIGRLRDLFGAPIEYDRARKGYRYTEQFVHQAMTKVRMMLPQSIEVAGRYQLLTQAIEDQRTIETDY